MKKKLDFKVLAIMGVVVFSACGSDSDLFNPEKAAAKKEAQYASAFVQRYGEIAVDQDWGFGVTPTTRVANTNSNQLLPGNFGRELPVDAGRIAGE